jgi:Arc/MetJ-type ribon-helix-helix transcriptional regulator
MTKLASSLVREGLRRLEQSDQGEAIIVQEETPAADPDGRNS